MMEFRFAGNKDRALVIELLTEMIQELGPTDVAERVSAKLPADTDTAFDADSIVFVIAEIDGEAVGVARADILLGDPIFRLRHDDRCGYVDQMYIRPTHRGLGIGAQLLVQCERWFKQQGITHCVLHAAPKAVRFYARQGYQPNREMFKKL